MRFETFSYRNITDKDTMFVAICKAKIIVPAKRPLLQMLCCPPALGKGAVIGCSGHIVAVSLLVNIGFCSRSTYKIYNETTIKLEKTPIENNTIRIVGSRSHQTPELLAYVDEQKEKYANVEFVAAGSSLKFCLIAEGKADVYPRLGPTMEWDTCAGQIVATEAGAVVLRFDTNEPLLYNRENLLNPYFIVKNPEL